MAQQQYKPLLDKRAAEQMNLTVLRRLDPAVEELLATAGHVALYDFDIPTKRWSRKDVEGSLFLVKRRDQPRFQFVILNKKSADNFVEDVMGNFQCEVNKPYLLYRNKAGEVVGIWFYEDSECDKISELLTRIATTFAAPEDAVIGSSQVNGGSTAASITPDAARAAAPGGGWAGHGAGTGAANAVAEVPASSGGDDGFWDRQVEVPAELDMPQLSVQASSKGPIQLQQQQQPAQQQEPAAAAPPAAAPAAAAAGDNSLMRIFAGMKVSPQPVQTQQPQATPQQQQQQQPAATGASPGVLPLLSPMAASALATPPPQAEAPPAPAAAAAAPAPAQAPPSGGLPLLTPQFLRQQAAAPAATAQPQAPQQAETAGQVLLKQLQGLARPASVAPAAAPAAPVPAPAPAAATAGGGAPHVDLNEAAELALHAKVRAFLHGLADNRAVVEAVAGELRKAGLV